ncbi:hypothetical protein HNQ02_001653 [Flavobacterium sp. 7E]|uniref:hypothetical protein n=1 Tax=Flavobacterium sp. 7E TaxID=2735898 RepID=UPI00156E38F0|nr:hypothetical protein [Flavobacterium sp. 7E]NRS88735.1 hypothetical protein [Flavobacterium sp. 7E]
MNEISPPLKIWGYAVSITVFIILVFMIVPNNTDNQKHKYIQYNLRKAIIKNNETSSTNTSIVFLGSSLTGCALENIPQIENKISKNKSSKSSVLRVAISGLNYKTIDQIRFFDFITKYPPSYLFIEINHLNIDDKSSNEMFDILESSTDNMITFIKKTLGFSINYEFMIGETSLDNPFYKDHFNTVIYSRLLLKKRFVRTFLQNKTANTAYAELIKSNTKIIFLDMPRASKLESVWLDKSQKKELATLMDTYKEKYGIECWKYPSTMNDSDFSDGGHLNYKGAKKYEQWFVNKFNLLK